MSNTLWRLFDPAVLATGTFGVALTLFVVGAGRAGVITLVVGWFLLTPLSAVLEEEVFDEDLDEAANPMSDSAEPETEDPVERLRERYASGEIDDAEFERRLDALVETEDANPETARDRLRDRSSSEGDLDDLDLDDLDEGTGEEREREVERE